MSLYKIVLSWGQSPFDGRVNRTSANESWLVSSPIVPNVYNWDGTSIGAYDLTDFGQSGNGTSWLQSNSNGLYGADIICYKEMGALYDNILICKVTNGGAFLASTASTNGTFNVDLLNTNLLLALKTKYNALLTYLGNNGHTYEVLRIDGYQGHADSLNPFSYQVDLEGLYDEMMSWTGCANIPFTIALPPRPSPINSFAPSQYSYVVETAMIDFEAAHSNVYLYRGSSNATLTDGTHEDANAITIQARWMLDTFLGIGRTYTGDYAKILPPTFKRSVNWVDMFCTAAVISAGTIKTALENLYAGLVTDDLWDDCISIYPVVGGTSATHALNLKNPYYFPCGFSGTAPTHSSTGEQMNGGYINTGAVIDEVPLLSSLDWAAHLYSGTNSANDNSSDFVFLQGTADFSASGFTSFASSSSNMRMNISASGVQPFETNVQSAAAVTDARGLFSFQSGGGNLEVARNGVVLGTTAWNYDLRTNSKINFGWDGGTRYTTKEYRFLAITKWMNTAKLANFYSRIQTFQTALGRNV